MILETDRLILRPWCEDDAEDLFISKKDSHRYLTITEKYVIIITQQDGMGI